MYIFKISVVLTLFFSTHSFVSTGQNNDWENQYVSNFETMRSNSIFEDKESKNSP